MNNFLKDMMKLATKLNQANGFDAVVVINEMELLYNKHVAELKNLTIPDVSNLACDLLRKISKENMCSVTADEEIHAFLNKHACY